MSRRVVVTGLGAVTPIGNNVDDFWTSVKAGKIGFDHITKFDTTDYKCHIAAELKDFNPQDFMDRKAAKRMEPFSQYAVAAAKQAIDDSGLDIEKEDPYMVDVPLVQVSEVFRLWSARHKSFMKRDQTESILCLFRL